MKKASSPKRAIYYDTETTGTRPGKDRVIEIAAFVPGEPGQEKSFCTFTNPECSIPAESSAISGITDAMVASAPLIRDAISSFLEFCGKDNVVLIAHNNDAFDRLFLDAEFQRAGLSMPVEWIFAD